MEEKQEIVDKLPANVIPPTNGDSEVIEGAVTPFEGDYMEVTVDVAKHLAEYEKAIDTIMNFIIRRCYAGDFVSHDKESTPLEDRTVNLIGAAAERIARDLGIQESNRTQPLKKMNEKFPGHYNYQCEGDFTFRGRSVHAIGIASTRNPFYSRAYGQDKKPEEIREEYIQRECWRDCTKQGIKGLFGLRRIPLMKLKELGYDISKVKYVNFKEGEKSAGKVNPNATAAPTGTEAPVSDGNQSAITIDDMKASVSKKGKPFYAVTDSEGSRMYVWGDAKSDNVNALLIAWRDKKPVNVIIKTSGNYSTITEIVK